MSSDTDDATPDDAPEPDEADAEDQPDIEDDEMAEWGAVGEEVADDPDDADEDTDEDTDEQASDEETDELGGMDPSSMDTSLGDIYCNGLGLGAAAMRDRYGELDEDMTDAMDEYAALARQLDIDQYLNEYVQQQGGMSELSPGQALVLMTLLFPMVVAVDDPTLASNAMGGFDGL